MTPQKFRPVAGPYLRGSEADLIDSVRASLSTVAYREVETLDGIIFERPANDLNRKPVATYPFGSNGYKWDPVAQKMVKG